MKTLVLDFDGVIVDSMNEGLFTSFNTYIEINPNTKLFGNKKFSFNDFKKKIKDHKTEYDKFRAYRAYLKNAIDYYYQLNLIESNTKIKNYGGFKIQAAKIGVNKKEFIERFYKNRKGYIANDFENWVKLTPIFNHMKRLFENKKIQLYISTSNRSETVQRTLGHYGIKFNPESIMDNTFSLDKNDHFRNLMKKNNVNSKDIFFVDDQVDHLINAKKLGINIGLASWGYNNKEQKKEAKKIGAVMLSENNFYSKIGI
ncbi:MAG TPA: HAD family hydrolase [Candidatus Nanoarchaeia archaeon]|nr:HAD family hydrolase [Candidatus Nanoarchaeia archaeon]